MHKNSGNKSENTQFKGKSSGSATGTNNNIPVGISVEARKILLGENNFRPIFKKRHVMHATHAAHGWGDWLRITKGRELIFSSRHIYLYRKNMLYFLYWLYRPSAIASRLYLRARLTVRTYAYNLCIKKFNR